MLARDRMVSPVVTVTPNENIWSALARMREGGITHLLVLDQSRLVGIVSNRDYRNLLDRVKPDGTIRGIFDVPVAEIMTPEHRVVTASPDTDVAEIGRLMVARKIGCVPIVDGKGAPLGILTYRDVLGALLPSPSR